MAIIAPQAAVPGQFRAHMRNRVGMRRHPFNHTSLQDQ